MFARNETVFKLMRSLPDREIRGSAWIRKRFGAKLDRWLADSVERFDYPTFKLALMLGADPQIDACIGTDYPLATRIARSDEPDFLRSLLSFGADVRANGSPGGYLPIHMAASKGAGRTLRVLIEFGADVGERYLHPEGTDSKTSTVGWSALIIACKQSKPAAIAPLLAAGADPNDRDGSGASVLDMCEKSGCAEGARMIREAMARVATK